MASTTARNGEGRLARWRDGFNRAARRSGTLFGGLALSLVSVFALLSLVSYRPSDPSLNTAAGGPVGNWMGDVGAWLADLLLSLMGPPSGLLLPLGLVIGLPACWSAAPSTACPPAGAVRSASPSPACSISASA
jgi:S-DNA-T family DNA segregation ATPase FtsK/SpoIIIE